MCNSASCFGYRNETVAKSSYPHPISAMLGAARGSVRTLERGAKSGKRRVLRMALATFPTTHMSSRSDPCTKTPIQLLSLLRTQKARLSGYLVQIRKIRKAKSLRPVTVWRKRPLQRRQHWQKESQSQRRKVNGDNFITLPYFPLSPCSFLSRPGAWV